MPLSSKVIVTVITSAIFASADIARAQEALDDLVLAAWVFGDSISGGGTVLTFRSVLDPLAKPLPEADVPVGGGTARLRIADNNKALPQDRIYFSYNNFDNAFMVQPGAASGKPPQQFSVSRYTLGYEKTLLSELASIELRVPVTGTYQYFSDDFGVRGSNAGNISLITKYLLSRSETASSVIGLGLNLPTGTDINGNISDVGYSIQNEAFHFVPYWGYLGAPSERSFFHAFLSTDFGTRGNPVFASSFGEDNVQLGSLTDQTLFSVDAAAGRWFHRNSNAPLLTGVAGILEFHYTTTLQDADVIGGVVDTTLLEFGNVRNRSDTLNATAGLHFEFAVDTSFRVGCVFPLRKDPDRDFDAEVFAQFIHRFGTTQTRARRQRTPCLAGLGIGRLFSLPFMRCPSRPCSCCNPGPVTNEASQFGVNNSPHSW